MKTARRCGLLFALVLSLTLLAMTAERASAQVYSQLIVFGDSNVDTGFYRGFPDPGSIPAFNALWPAAVTAGAGSPTTSGDVGTPNPMYPARLGQLLGLTAHPSNQPGGTNYGCSACKNVDPNNAETGGFTRGVPVVTQIATYLASVGNVADPDALYLVHTGGSNDISYATGQSGGTGPLPSDPVAYVTATANALADAINSLKTAGARHFLVPNVPGFSDATRNNLSITHNSALYTRLTTLGVSVIAVNFRGLNSTIQSNPGFYGLTQLGTDMPACVPAPSLPTFNHGMLCSASPSAPEQFADPIADLQRLRADGVGHYATTGQRIRANFAYALLPSPGPSPLVAAVLPASRSVQVNSAATAFVTIFNSGTTAATGCQFNPTMDVPGRFSFQTTNPATNALIGTANTPVSIAAGASQSFLLAFAPTFGAYFSNDVRFAFVCKGVPAATPLVGINTLRLVVDANPVPDMITIGVTPSNDGYVRTGGPTGTGLFVISSVNIGVAATLTVRARVTGSNTPVTATICQTNAQTGQCLAPPSATVTTAIAHDEITTWGAFLQASGPVPPDPAQYRVFFEFLDPANVSIVRGATSSAITTE